ncbi:MAG TPA: SHOCT domain-containing protein [Acidimicrobiia bacterium]|jgi:hypothetical protein
MGLLFRRRRPVMRLAAGAATAGVAYHMGKKSAQQNEYNEQAQQAYEATTAVAPSPQPTVPAPPAAGGDSVAELERLAALHSSGALTDDEFAAAKASLLGT